MLYPRKQKQTEPNSCKICACRFFFFLLSKHMFYHKIHFHLTADQLILFFISIFQTSAITQRISPCSTLTSSTASPPASSPCSTLPPVSTNATAKDGSYGAVTSPTSTLESRDSGIIGELVYILIILCLFSFCNNYTSLRFSKILLLSYWDIFIKYVSFSF